MEGFYNITMKVNHEMEETLKGIFANCGWNYDDFVTRTEETVVQQTVDHSVGLGVGVGEAAAPVPEMPHLQAEGDKCPHCYLCPCVTQRPNNFLGAGQDACEMNSGLRKNFYRGYWKAMSFLGGWDIPQYKHKKVTAGTGEWVLRHRREIMPYCVLKQVRTLYPNPPGIPYMGHKWE